MSATQASISILICTRNHLAHLQETIRTVAALEVPPSLRAELIVIDNGSEDGTANWVQRLRLPNMAVRLIVESTPGQAHARNAGLAAAEGEVILFTDDDVRLPTNWLTAMSAPILAGKADAVRGKSVLSETLVRPWMLGFHRAVLAVTEGIDEGGRSDLVGLSMGFSRRVLEQIPAFDPELGPGTAAGFLDDTLFSYQVHEAGFRIANVLDAPVEHVPEADRLDRSAFLRAAEGRGRALAYIGHHWEHADESRWTRRRSSRTFWRNPRIVAAKRAVNLWAWRVLNPTAVRIGEGIAFGEFNRVNQLSQIRCYLEFRHQPRNYALRGLRKLRGDLPRAGYVDRAGSTTEMSATAASRVRTDV